MRNMMCGALVALIGLAAAPALAQNSQDPSQAQLALAASLHPRQGQVGLPEAHASLNLGTTYDFLGPAEAKRVLVEAWGNPPDSVKEVLGMILPHGKSFIDADWGAVITYDQTFYVSDKAAAKSDYDKLLKDMQSGEADANAERRKAGFQPVHLVGWAEAPSYDRAHHDLVWAREIQFEGESPNTLNYDVRHLGRAGVLSLNVIATMPQLAQVHEAAREVAAAAEFDPGARYADHEASDKRADYGLVGLVAAGAGLAVAQKAGLLGLLVILAKKGLVVIFAGGAAIAAWFRRLFGRSAKPGAADEPPATQSEDPAQS